MDTALVQRRQRIRIIPCRRRIHAVAFGALETPDAEKAFPAFVLSGLVGKIAGGMYETQSRLLVVFTYEGFAEP